MSEYQTLEDLTDEFIEKNGDVTCEMSFDNLTERLGIYLIQQNKKLEPLKHFWVALPCWVCHEVHNSGSWHLQIMKDPSAIFLEN